MKLNWNFLGVWGCKTENLPWGEYGYFLELHIFNLLIKAAPLFAWFLHQLLKMMLIEGGLTSSQLKRSSYYLLSM